MKIIHLIEHQTQTINLHTLHSAIAIKVCIQVRYEISQRYHNQSCKNFLITDFFVVRRVNQNKMIMTCTKFNLKRFLVVQIFRIRFSKLFQI